MAHVILYTFRLNLANHIRSIRYTLTLIGSNDHAIQQLKQQAIIKKQLINKS